MTINFTKAATIALKERQNRNIKDPVIYQKTYNQMLQDNYQITSQVDKRRKKEKND